jgi:hypothetical protein
VERRIILKWVLIRMRVRNSFAQTELIGGFFWASRVPSVFRDLQFRSGEDEETSLLGCYAVSTGR